MNQQEYRLREKLAASHHILHYLGLDDLLATHLSIRIPSTNEVLLSPKDVAFEKVCASNIVKCDMEGNILGDNGCNLMQQAKNIHLGIYQQHPDIHSVIHTHSVNGVALSSLKCGLLYTNQQVLRFYQKVAYHDYHALALEEEGRQLGKLLADNFAIILRNHGLLTAGNSVEQALYRMYYLEVACQIQLKTLSAGSEIITIPADICEKTFKQFQSIKSEEKEFLALVERIKHRSSVDYKD